MACDLQHEAAWRRNVSVAVPSSATWQSSLCPSSMKKKSTKTQNDSFKWSLHQEEALHHPNIFWGRTKHSNDPKFTFVSRSSTQLASQYLHFGGFFFFFNAEATQKDLISYLHLTNYSIPNKNENIKIKGFFFTFQGHGTGTQPVFPFWSFCTASVSPM